ncbi:MAG: hypothetical protein GX600_07575 [Dehalococcoidia bacterium]|nr:hypothetical protein [Dehalococcoidia bacterium]
MNEAADRQTDRAEDLVLTTQRFWGQRASTHVSREDAREAIRNVSAVFDLLAEWDRKHAPTAHDDQREALHD